MVRSSLLIGLTPLALALTSLPASGQCIRNEVLKIVPQNPSTWMRLGLDLDTANGILVASTFQGYPTYVLRDQGSTWVEEALLPDYESVATDGVRIVGGNRLGFADVYVHDGTSWTIEATLTPVSSPVADFGWAVDIDDDAIIVGAPAFADPSAGAAYLFSRSGSTWSQTGTLDNQGLAEDFGTSVAISGDRIVVGGPMAWPASASPGYARISDHLGSGVFQDQHLHGDNLGDMYGADVAVDGDVALLGSPLDDYGTWLNVGSVDLRTHDGTSFTTEQWLVPPKLGWFEEYGHSVAVNGDFAAGAAPQGSFSITGGGDVSVWRNTGSLWAPYSVLVPQVLDDATWLGSGLAIDGNRVFAGMPNDGPYGGAWFGAILIFDLDALALDVTPESAGPGTLVTALVCGGAPSEFVVLAIVSPGFATFPIAVLDGEGQATYAAAAPPGLAGLTLQLQAYGFYQPGVAGLSNVASLTFL